MPLRPRGLRWQCPGSPWLHTTTPTFPRVLHLRQRQGGNERGAQHGAAASEGMFLSLKPQPFRGALAPLSPVSRRLEYSGGLQDDALVGASASRLPANEAPSLLQPPRSTGIGEGEGKAAGALPYAPRAGANRWPSERRLASTQARQVDTLP